MTVDGRRMFTGIIQDRSRLQLAETRSKQFAHIIENSVNEIYTFDADTLKFVQVNFGARKNIGYSQLQLADMTPVDIKPELTIDQFEKLISPLRAGTKELLMFNTVHQRKDGSTYPVEVNLQLMRSEQQSVFLAIVQDVTSKLNLEERLRQSQKMDAIGQLTGGVAQDFNNLLTVVIGNAELLVDRIEDDEFSMALLSDALGAAESGAKLTGQLLSFARQQPLAPEAVDLNELVNSLHDMLSRTLGKAIVLKTSLAADLEKSFADRAQLQNALLNLAINARDAMSDGGDLTIETAAITFDRDMAKERVGVEPGRYVQLSVSDNGVGMSPEVQSRALEPFFTTKERGKGTGLGLSMVHGFAKQSAGHL